MASRFIPEGKRRWIKDDRHFFAFARLQEDLFKAFQFLGRPWHAGLYISHVDLRCLRRLHFTCIADGKIHLKRFVSVNRVRRKTQVAQLKLV